MLVSQISVFIHFYIAETENEVKIKIDDQRATFQRYVDVYINLYYLDVFGLRFSQLDVICVPMLLRTYCDCYTILCLPSSLCSVSNQAFRRGWTILSVSSSSMRMFS